MKRKLVEVMVPSCPDPQKDGLVWRDISNEIKLKDGKANPFGWSQYRMEWNGETIGWIESGAPHISNGQNIQMVNVIDPADNIEHVFFFKGLSEDD